MLPVVKDETEGKATRRVEEAGQSRTSEFGFREGKILGGQGLGLTLLRE